MLFRKIVLSICIFLSQSLFSLDLELTQGMNAALPIGVSDFSGDAIGAEMKSIIENDLRLSGQFRIVLGRGKLSSEEEVSFFKREGADSLLKARIEKTGFNQYEVHFDLLDTVQFGKKLLDKTFQMNAQDKRALAHHISDLVYEKLTGERGVFSTRIAYVLVKRQGMRARYSLEVADSDGFNPQSLLVSPEPIMSPAWSPDGRYLAYVSFEKKKSQIYIAELETGHRRLVTDFSGINGAPAWSPDGRNLAVVLSKSGTPKIYNVNLDSGSMKQLTFGGAIDTEPRFSPDGKSILFTSGRGGAPQVYRLGLQDGKITRVTYDGSYNAKAVYTPNQKYIVMLHREDDKSFHIGKQDAATGAFTSLTYAALDESPTVAPNGHLIMYATRENDKGILGIVSIDGKIHMRFPARDGDVQEPAWSPWIR